jgi:hypothetical protein
VSVCPFVSPSFSTFDLFIDFHETRLLYYCRSSEPHNLKFPAIDDNITKEPNCEVEARVLPHNAGSLMTVVTDLRRFISAKYCHVIRVTIDGVWYGNWIYWTLTNRNYSAITNSRSSSSLQQVLSLLSLLCLRRLSGNSFSCRSFLSSRGHILTGRRRSHD